MSSPTQRTLERLRREGWLAAVVERWNPHAMVRQDLFGLVDVLALRGHETLAVQATSASNVASRVSKLTEHEHLGALREAGWRIEVWGWRRRQLKGAKRAEWICRVVDIS